MAQGEAYVLFKKLQNVQIYRFICFNSLYKLTFNSLVCVIFGNILFENFYLF